MEILRSIDVENIIRLALTDYFQIYCRPLPEKFTVPSLEVSRVGGTDKSTIDTFDVVLDSRAKNEAEADELLRTAIGALKQIAKEQTTPLRHVEVNTSGSWGTDPVRPDLAMCSARLRIVAHQEKIIINRR
jgi:hypothetical protein